MYIVLSDETKYNLLDTSCQDHLDFDSTYLDKLSELKKELTYENLDTAQIYTDDGTIKYVISDAKFSSFGGSSNVIVFLSKISDSEKILLNSVSELSAKIEQQSEKIDEFKAYLSKSFKNEIETIEESFTKNDNKDESNSSEENNDETTSSSIATEETIESDNKEETTENIESDNTEEETDSVVSTEETIEKTDSSDGEEETDSIVSDTNTEETDENDEAMSSDVVNNKEE